jgi:hypothetical protein
VGAAPRPEPVGEAPEVLLVDGAEWFALTALAMTLGAIITLSLTGHDTVAGVMAGSVIVPVVGLYITARYPQVQRTDTV